MSAITNELVLVTGGSGFVGVYCILKCLEANYRVRTTVRSLDKEKYVRDMLKAGNAINLDNLTFVEADLAKEYGWSEAIKDCTYILHVASPFPPGPPKDENDLIIPARDGTLRILRAARDAKVKRVVITSSFAAIGYGDQNKDRSKPFTEEDWTDPNDHRVGAYEKSKTIAERAAWDFIEKEGGSLELSVVNPASISGPVLGTDISLSVQTVLRLMNGAIPGCPNLSFGIVDVRDVADLHLLAMTDPKAKGERFLAVAPPPMTIKEMSLALHEKMGNAARRAPTRQLPDFLLRIIAWFDPAVALVIPWLGESKPVSNDKAKTLLNWKPRSNVDAIVASAESMIKLDIRTQLPRNPKHPLWFSQELSSDQNYIGHRLLIVLGIGHLLRCLGFQVDGVLKLSNGTDLLDNVGQLDDVSRLLCFRDQTNNADEKLQVIGMHGIPDKTSNPDMVAFGVNSINTLAGMVAATTDVQ